ncbi:MDIS1-interacting receptor like kinase 2-like [Hevea brasiliensis]|uniref:MDIS1-interacting receptor like kinase 2-like n=1 Tax=Hevea brasiliensis TaxID=3981 RepID=UPI0025FD77C9|nr:MDIS1-interacting receptor like kinase 2-like [Hevea brasiliensis]
MLNLSHNNLSGSIPDSFKDMQVLVYEYLEGGNLATILDKDKKAKNLDWSKRANIVKGVANALSYMHHNCSPPIVHRDITSKNILLDSEFEAHVSDFGIVKLLNSDFIPLDCNGRDIQECCTWQYTNFCSILLNLA